MTKKDHLKNVALLLSSSVVAGVTIVLASVVYKNFELDATMRFAVALVPIATILLFFYTFIRLVQNLDEMMQKLYLQSLAISFGLTALVTYVVGVLQRAGLLTNSLRWYYVYVVMVVIFSVTTAVLWRRYR